MVSALKWHKDDVNAQAAYWFALLRSDVVEKSQKRAFDIWYKAAPAHAKVYDRLCRNWIAAEALAQDDDIIALRDAALLPRARSISERPLLAISGLAASLIVALGLSLFLAEPRVPAPSTVALAENAEQEASALMPIVLSTEVGERSTIQLSDGSSVELNTDTEVEVRYTDSRRNLILVRGQALFKVAKNPDRPFMVYAGGRVITALGTEFEVRMNQSDVAVTLVEGRITVTNVNLDEARDEPADVDSVELVAGQVYDSARGVLSDVSEDALERALSWRQGRLDFQNETLADVVIEINRYSRRKLVLSDPSIGELYISGSFKAGSVENFATAMTALYPLTLEEAPNRDQLVLSWYKG
jgi:transmembrane sensor